MSYETSSDNNKLDAASLEYASTPVKDAQKLVALLHEIILLGLLRGSPRLRDKTLKILDDYGASDDDSCPECGGGAEFAVKMAWTLEQDRIDRRKVERELTARALIAERELADLRERTREVRTMICRELAEPPDNISTEFAERILAMLPDSEEVRYE